MTDDNRVRGLRRFARVRRSSLLTYATRGLVIAGMAGVAWILGTAVAQASTTDSPHSSDGLVPATASIFDGVVPKSEQAARSIQSNQLQSGAPSHIDVAKALVSDPSEKTDDSLARGHHGSAFRLVEQPARNLSLDAVTAKSSKPLAEVTRPVATPVTHMARPVVNPVTDMVSPVTRHVETKTTRVWDLLSETTAPVTASDADVASMLSPMADGGALSELINDAAGTGIDRFRGPDASRISGAEAASHDNGGDPGRLAASGNATGAAALSGHAPEATANSGPGSADPDSPFGPSMPPRAFLATGASTAGSGAAFGGAPYAGSVCVGAVSSFHDARVSRVRPDSATMGRRCELIADPAVSPD
ncbi:MAG TPA: hypothetical protein VE172_20565 [Stackebrandtia sp.]|jgi:hypothetical protein|uniref:hypothetical protein n=1 Tax=Stackebrandtia sp. TaxID=2023065 RepID=UPI002D5B71C8|nr:hypothetical protein [Stackebrandtia sp.]HZE41200.1 hypothetical protein [Stackebrandtia sp.]